MSQGQAVGARRQKSPPGFLTVVFGSPAVLLTLLLPGLGHLFHGRPGRALAWFALVQGLFFAGYAILGVRLWGGGFNLGTDVLGLPLNYLPEAGNFLTTLLMLKTFPGTEDAVALAKLPVAWEHLGFLLTALSGVLNAFACADAWWIAARPEAPARGRLRPVEAALLSWLLPGLGQWRLGARFRGGVQGGAVLGLFLLGLVFSDFTAVDRSQVYFWYAGMCFNGGGTIAATLLFAERAFTNTGSTLWDLGVTLCTVSGLMNLVVALDAYTLAEEQSPP